MCAMTEAVPPLMTFSGIFERRLGLPSNLSDFNSGNLHTPLGTFERLLLASESTTSFFRLHRFLEFDNIFR